MPDIDLRIPGEEINQIIVETIGEQVRRSAAMGNSGIEQATREALDGLDTAIKRNVSEAFYRLMVRKPALLENILEAGITAAGSKLAGKLGAVMASNGKVLADAQIKQIKEDLTLTKLRHLLGYVENGTSGPVSICQDDATCRFVVTYDYGKSQSGDSLEAAIDAAYEAMPKDEAGYPT